MSKPKFNGLTKLIKQTGRFVVAAEDTKPTEEEFYKFLDEVFAEGKAKDIIVWGKTKKTLVKMFKRLEKEKVEK